MHFAGRRSGLLRDLEEDLKGLPREEKPASGRPSMSSREAGRGPAWRRGQRLVQAKASSGLDDTLPGRRPVVGSLHPVTLVRREIESIFLRMG